MTASANTAKNCLHTVEIETAGELAAMLEECLTAAERPYAAWRNPGTDAVILRVYCETAQAAELQARQLREWLDQNAGLFDAAVPPILRRQLLKEDWTESWKKNFHAFRASPRLVVKPSWEEYRATDGDVVLEIDPGMTFGTGYHGTTRACLQFIDELAAEFAPAPFIDAGCGSGILSLAAARLGFAPVMAFDNDPAAVQIAREHLAGFPCAEVVQSDAGDFTPTQNARVVVANILAHVLMDNATALTELLDRANPPSYLIASGILDSQYAEVRGAFAACGLHHIRSILIDEWRSGLFVAAENN